MSAIDFFNPACQQTCAETEFGLVDPGGNLPAKIDLKEPALWGATVDNPQRITVVFTAIDNCGGFISENLQGQKRCDGILTYHKTIYFVELKAQQKNWRVDAMLQLEDTIRLFRQHYDLQGKYSRRTAFLCNRQHPRFQVIDNVEQERFYQTYGVRLDATGSIRIK